MNIHANTEATGPNPAYISINDRHNNHVTITVRSRGNEGRDIGSMTMTREDALRMAADITKHFAKAGDVDVVPGMRSAVKNGNTLFLTFGNSRDTDRALGAISNAVGASEPVADIRGELGQANVPNLGTMVTRFLGWRLPKEFAPDAGVAFEAPVHPLNWPHGTNLLNAEQAKGMIVHILTGGAK